MKIIETFGISSQEIMDLDGFLLDTLKEPVLHFYSWPQDSLTYGYFIDIQRFIDIKKAKEKNLTLAKRPTGGGIVFHIWDIAFSFLLPSSDTNFFLDTISNYKFVNSIVLEALDPFLSKMSLLENFKKKDFLNLDFCMAKPTTYDVMYKNFKIAGSAQRKKKTGYLHQSSICLIKHDFKYLEDVLLDENIANLISKNSFAIFDGESLEKIDEKRALIKENLTKAFQNKIS